MRRVYPAVVAALALTCALLLARLAVAAPGAGGDLDPTFGDNGKVISSFAIGALRVQGDGKLLAGGTMPRGDLVALSLARYKPDGELDPGFGSNGISISDITVLQAPVRALELQQDGKIVVAASTFSQHRDPSVLTVARFNADGTPDRAFGVGGKTEVAFGHESSFDFIEVNRLAIQPDGKIVVVGRDAEPWVSDLALVRFDASGRIDAGFGSGGRVIGDYGIWDSARDVAILDGGKILVAGLMGSNQRLGYLFTLARYNADGSLDAGFGENGLAKTDIKGRIDDMSVLADGRIVATGEVSAHVGFGLARFTAAGRLDESFGSGGSALARIPGHSGGAYALKAQPDGNLLLAGGFYADGEKRNVDIGLVRYQADGTLDPSFGVGGIVLTDLGGDEAGGEVVLQPDGKIVLTTLSGPSYSPAVSTLLRYQNTILQPTPTIGPGCVFSDVCQSDYFYTPVRYLLERGIVSGYGDNTFRPYNSATRAQVAKMVVLAYSWQIDTTGGPHFDDVPPAYWAYPYVETMFNRPRPLISGYDDGSFRPFATTTRGQFAKVIVGAQGWEPDTSGGPHFSDVPPDNPFYGDIESAFNHGLISGYDDGTFRWGESITRGQLGKIIHAAVSATDK